MAGSDAQGRGRTTVAPRAVERLAVGAARESSRPTGAQRGLARLVGGGLPKASAVVAGESVRLSVEIAVPWPHSLSAAAGRARDHVGTRVGTLSGLEVVAVDVEVAEMSRDPHPHRVS